MMEHERDTEKLEGENIVKLNAFAQEFVPRSKKEESTKEEADEIKKSFETTKAQTKKITLTLPWKGFPKKTERPARSTQVVLLNDVDYTILPRIKRAKNSNADNPLVVNVPTTSSKNLQISQKRFDAEEKRRENERKVALEAIKLVEQRRMSGSIVPTNQENENSKVEPIIHLSRSPIRFSPEERIRVDRLRAAKKERIERVLREMTNEKQEQLMQQSQNMMNKQTEKTEEKKGEKKTEEIVGSNEENKLEEKKPEKNKEESVVVPPKRFIPTTKEWDELCRAKYMPKSNGGKDIEANQPTPRSTAPLNRPQVNPNLVDITPSGVIRLGDLRATAKPRYCPPTDLLETEKRKGNLTHFRPLPNWTTRQKPQAQLKELVNQKGRVIKRYSIEQLLQLEPQPKELEKPCINEHLKGLGFVCE